MLKKSVPQSQVSSTAARRDTRAQPMPIAETRMAARSPPQRAPDIRSTLRIREGMDEDEISATTSDSVAYIDLSSRLQAHFRGRHRLGHVESGGYVFDRTGWLWKRQLALSPTYAFACAGMTKDRRFAITFYKTEINEQATYITDPVDLVAFQIYYDSTAKCFRADLTVREGKKGRFQTIAFSDRRYMPLPFDIVKSEDRTIPLKRV
ncbi:Uncharacterised protein [uncultured archaeon]|nr:Uncharacterised protein [uncultured archaeon]